jgi:general secretion pathway protein E
VQAGLTGHLVISTIHSGVSAGAFTRLINMNIEPFMLSSSILAVMGIRLVRRNCPHCSQAYELPLSQVKLVPENMLATASFLRGAGCDQCVGTGYLGRFPVSELLVVDEPFREAILKKVPTRALEQIAVDNGMQRLWDNGIQRAVTGQTTMDEIVRVLAAEMV